MKTQKRIAIAGILAVFAIALVTLAACKDPTDLPSKTLIVITLNTDSVKKAYNQDELINLSGLIVTAFYSDSSSAAVANYTTSPANGATLSTAGTITVTVSYTEEAVTKTAPFIVNVTNTGGNPNDITYTATQTGGANGTADSTGIVFTFSASVDTLNLTAADITVSGVAEKDAEAALTLSGTTRTLPITVSAAGMAMVTINKPGIEAVPKSVLIYKAGQTAPEYCTITYEFNGGAAGAGAPHPTLTEKNKPLAQPFPNPTKTNNIFAGWYTDPGLTQPYNFASPVTDDLTLYAKWDSNNSFVYFFVNGGSPAPEQQFITLGEKVIKPPDTTKTGYTFGGWYKEYDFINLWDFTTDTVTDLYDLYLYAKWDIINYTVCFEANGGIPAPQNQITNHDYYYGRITEPAYMTKSGYSFSGWYKEANFINLWNFATDTVTGDITLYAKWEPPLPPLTVTGETLAAKFQWLNLNAASNGTYILEVSSDEYLNAHTLSYSGKSNISIQLIGIGGVRNIELYGSGSLFTVGNSVTLILNENIVLKGSVTTGGNLIMNDGAKITNGEIQVNSGTFTMNGGEISGNTSYDSGGVYVSARREYDYDTGGYVYTSGTFTMTGGKISSNSNGGVYMVREYDYNTGQYIGGTFTMTGGEISGNSGGGVRAGGTFTMNGGKISGNTDGGVRVEGTFTMTGGTISGNTSSSYYGGGGVYISSGTFTMSGGEISGNTVSSNYFYDDVGGGVYISSNSRFEKTGGIITGYSSDTVNGNVVKDSNGNALNNRGHAVYVAHDDSRFVRRKETTAGTQNNLIYIRNEPAPPTISGAWDDPVPEAPGAPVVTPADGSLNVQWTAVEGALSYEVWIGTDSYYAEYYAEKQGEDVYGTSVTLTGLSNGTTYYIWLKAKNNIGTSGFSPGAGGIPD